ncbi:MAG: hypothetical protein ABL961_11610 [Vicinamibacterales bacterium]
MRTLNIPYGSEQASTYVEDAISGKGWLPSSCLHLLQADLNAWMAVVMKDAVGEADPALSSYNTISRWKFNEALASRLSVTKPVTYVPAYGRSIEVDAIHAVAWDRRLSVLRAALQQATLGQRLRLRDLLEVAPARSMGMPLFGIWVIRGISDSPCTLERLADAIARAREDPRFVRFKHWLLEASDDDVRGAADDAVQEFARTHGRMPVRVEQAVSKWKAVLELPVIPGYLKVKREDAGTTSTMREKATFFRRLTMPRHVTALVGLFEGAFVPRRDGSLLECVQQIIASASRP